MWKPWLHKNAETAPGFQSPVRWPLKIKRSNMVKLPDTRSACISSNTDMASSLLAVAHDLVIAEQSPRRGRGQSRWLLR